MRRSVFVLGLMLAACTYDGSQISPPPQNPDGAIPSSSDSGRADASAGGGTAGSSAGGVTASGGISGAAGAMGGSKPAGASGSTSPGGTAVGGAAPGGTPGGGALGGSSSKGGEATRPSTAGSVSSGGTTSSSASTASVPVGVLAVFTKGEPVGANSLELRMRIDNKSAQAADLSTVTLRYWYQDEGLAEPLIVDSNYVAIGASREGRVSGVKVVRSTGGAGADHYLEFSMAGILAAQGAKDATDQLTMMLSVHDAVYSGRADVTNDYSYNAGAIGYNDKITLHSAGKVIWGTPPDLAAMVTADSGMVIPDRPVSVPSLFWGQLLD